MMQAGRDYSVRVVRPFLQFREGFVMSPLYREKLLRGKWVEEVKPGEPKKPRSTKLGLIR